MEINVTGNVYINFSDEDKTSDRSIQTIRRSPAVSTAKRNVKNRDKVCQVCGEIGTNGHLEIHHILPVAKYKELASDERNMIALCQSCHHKYHEKYDGCEGADTFAKFIRDKTDGVI